MTRVSVLQFVGTRSLRKHDNRKFLKGFGHFRRRCNGDHTHLEYARLS